MPRYGSGWKSRRHLEHKNGWTGQGPSILSLSKSHIIADFCSRSTRKQTNWYSTTPAAAPEPPSKAYVDFATDCLFRPSPSKLGAGYTCSLQAMSCVSRALPDLTARGGFIQAILSNGDVPYAAAYHACVIRAGSGGKSNLFSPGRLSVPFAETKGTT